MEAINPKPFLGSAPSLAQLCLSTRLKLPALKKCKKWRNSMASQKQFFAEKSRKSTLYQTPQVISWTSSAGSSPHWDEMSGTCVRVTSEFKMFCLKTTLQPNPGSKEIKKKFKIPFFGPFLTFLHPT